MYRLGKEVQGVMGGRHRDAVARGLTREHGQVKEGTKGIGVSFAVSREQWTMGWDQKVGLTWLG